MDFLTENRPTTTPEPERRSQRYALIALLLLLLSLGWGAYQWNVSKKLASANTVLSDQADSLMTAKNTLEQEVKTISGQLETVRKENTTLAENVTGLNNSLAEKDRVLERLRRENNSLGSLKKQVGELRKLRESLNDQLNKLTNDYERLNTENQQLRQQNTTLVAENDKLRQTPVAKVEEPKSTLPILKPNALRVEVLRRRENLTVKARRARKIAIIIDLPSEIGESALGKQTLYISLKDMAQRPLKAEDSRTVTVDAQSVMNPVTVHMSQVIDFSKSPQRLTFPYEIQEKLKAGIYSAELFTDKAFLGRVEFRLQ